MTVARMASESHIVQLGTDGAWHAYVELRRDPRTRRRKRTHIRREDRQEAVYLTLRARAAAHIARHGPQYSEQPETAAEWFWIWLKNGSYRRAAGIFTRHSGPFEAYVLPNLDERRLDILDAQEICRLLNEVPTLEGKDGALRVFSEALHTARARAWVRANVACDVDICTTQPAPVFFDDNDPALDPPDDPGIAVVRGI